MEKEAVEYGLNLNRRKFLSRLSIGVGSAALGSLLIPDLFSSKQCNRGESIGLTAFCPQGQTHHLPVSKWCAVAARFV
ncbi:twin-arginine translocation signal domain-containing protein [Phnomibacter ginsenosidimutans]|uniref:twin-arginine translocation signal domain-containing protein n=1 Tax=Phnomibacter ginsenosidimutans TaxID=2676868 RepID=UPI003CCDCD1B